MARYRKFYEDTSVQLYGVVLRAVGDAAVARGLLHQAYVDFAPAFLQGAGSSADARRELLAVVRRRLHLRRERVGQADIQDHAGPDHAVRADDPRSVVESIYFGGMTLGAVAQKLHLSEPDVLDIALRATEDRT